MITLLKIHLQHSAAPLLASRKYQRISIKSDKFCGSAVCLSPDLPELLQDTSQTHAKRSSDIGSKPKEWSWL